MIVHLARVASAPSMILCAAECLHARWNINYKEYLFAEVHTQRARACSSWCSHSVAVPIEIVLLDLS